MHHRLRFPQHLAFGLALFPILTLGTVAASADAATVPFRAAISETFTINPACFPARLCGDIIGSGQASHLGKITESATIVSYLSTPLGGGCFPETRTTTLTAANGDELTLVAAGTNCATSPTTVVASDAYTVTGGTGRFAGASGGGTVSATVDLATSTAVVTLSGTLSAPGA